MIIGVPKERKTLERRVALTPDGVSELVRHGHKVLIETNAGAGIHFTDEDYRSAGADVVDTLGDVWTKANMIVKVKEPHESEYQYFRPGLVVFDYLHLAGLPDVAKAMLDAKVTGIAYELVQTTDGRLPLLEPMSEVAGKLSVFNGAYFLLCQNGGRGLLLGGTLGVPPCRITIIGAGVAGRAACEIALGTGARVGIVDLNVQRLERVKMEFGARVQTIYSTRAMIERECAKSDLVIGAVLVPGASAPRVLSRSVMRAMNPGSVFVDISIDQGGCAETSKVMSLETPTYIEEGVVHYCVPNMPSQTARTSTMALTAATLPYIVHLADLGVHRAFERIPALRPALNTYDGKLTNLAVAESLGLPFTEAKELLG